MTLYPIPSARTSATLLLALATVACGGGAPEDPHEVAVAHVGDVAVSLADLDFYFSLNLLTDQGEGVAKGEDFDRVKSRLLDGLIEERMLLVEAERRGIEVSESEIDAYLLGPVDAEPVAGDPLNSPRHRDLARCRLMTHKLEASEAAQLPEVVDEDVQAYLESHRDRPSPRRRLRLRSLRLDSMETAEKVDREIREGRTNFARAVATHETGPGQGVPLELYRDNLPEEFRSVLDGMQPGEVTPPLEFHGEVYVFQFEAWLSESGGDENESTRRVRDEFDRARRRQANEALFRGLRERTPVQIHPDRLPFRYFPEKAP